MASRGLLHRSKLEAFKKWLGESALPPVGTWEVLRWKGPKGKPMRIIFDNDRSNAHLSVNDAAQPDVAAFIRAGRQHVAGTERRAVAHAQPVSSSAADLQVAVRAVNEYLQDENNAQTWTVDFRDWCTERIASEIPGSESHLYSPTGKVHPPTTHRKLPPTFGSMRL